jgi:glycine/D-amino acid oxidase-like deaminating enzyme
VYDLAIVGAGVMGLFTADFASQRGANVVVIDRSRVGDPSTASFSLTRSIRNDYLDPLYADLAYEARRLWLRFQQQTGELFVVDCGCLNIAKSSVTPDLPQTYAEQSYRVLNQVGRKTQAFDRDGLRKRFPQFDADLGRLDVEAGLLFVPAVTAGLRARLRDATVAIEEQCEVQGIRARDDAVTIDTSTGPLRAHQLVVTAGLGTNELLAAIEGCDIRFPLSPDRPSETKYVIPAPDVRHLFTPERLPVFAYLDVGIYGHPMLEGKTPGVKIGYYNPPDVRRQTTSIDSVASFIDTCLPSLRAARVVDVEGVDQCSYDLVADDNFILGPVPDLPRVLVGVGWRGTGYKFAPLVGRTLMELALDHRATIDLTRFQPGRFAASHAR